MENVRRYYQLLGQGKYNPEYEQHLLRQTLASQATTQAQLDYFAKTFVDHEAVYSELKDILSEFKTSMKEQKEELHAYHNKLNKISQLLNQRKLSNY